MDWKQIGLIAGVAIVVIIVLKNIKVKGVPLEDKLTLKKG